MNKRSIIELVIIFTVTLIINLTGLNFSLDEIWSFGFSYNISQGLIPYKDFNMVIFPFYPILNGIIMSLFGTNYLVFEITNAIICTAIFYYLKKLSPKNYYVLFILLLPISYGNYSLLCLLLTLMIITLEQKEPKNHMLIGLLIGLLFITKQNIGIIFILLTIYLYYKEPKIILKRLLIFCLPFLCAIIYLLLTNSVSSFINYTILGLLDFSEKNTALSPYTIAIITLTIYIIYRYFYKKDKQIILIYSLVSLTQNYPLFDQYHFIISIIPISIYILNRIKIPNYYLKLSFNIVIISLLTMTSYQIITDQKIIPNHTNNFKYKALTPYQDEIITTINNYIQSIPPTTYLFILDSSAYLYKIENNIDINKYDLINNGNMGYHGEQTYQKEIIDICHKKDCLFLINNYEFFTKRNQTNQHLLNYVINNYQYTEKIGNLYAYKN